MMASTLLKCLAIFMMLCCLGNSAPHKESCFPNACGQKGQDCQTPALKIWHTFCQSADHTAIPVSGVYSGICFHEADNRDPSYPHHGVVLFDKVDGKHHFGGEFSFFAERNPYRELDVKAARTRMPWFYAADHEIKWKNDHARILLNPEMETYDHVNYFLKKSPDNKDMLLLIGYWKGAAYRVFCELNRN
ncbi:MAG: hypothetical protein PVH44_02140 [Desulfobacterales bacterium]